MKHTEGSFRGVGNLELFFHCWKPDAKSRANLVIVHGVGEHSGRYVNLVNHLAACGYSAWAFDQRGFGRSPGQRGHINSWSEYRDDVGLFLKEVRQQDPGSPIFLYGHSMGALVVLDYVLHHPQGLRGAILSGTPIEPAGVAKPYLIALARFLSQVWPNFSLSLGLDAAALSRDPAVVKAYQTDPLVHSKVSVRWGTESLATVAWVKDHSAEFSIPLLLIHGSADRLSLASGARHLFESIPVSDKKLRVYEGSYHEAHNDLDYAQVVNDIGDWLDQHS